MIRWTELGVAAAPGGGRISLMRRGEEFSIMVDGAELMNSRRGGSEAALAVEACRRLPPGGDHRLLIGGLGMGFTLRAALAEVGPTASVTVAELLPEVVAWARGPLSPVFQDCLADPRVRLLHGDVGLEIAASRAAYDAILLDVDNGPDGLVSPANARLYSSEGLAAARRALRPGGVLAVWSASPDAAFARRLASAAFVCEEAGARSGGRRGARHVVYLATPGPGDSLPRAQPARNRKRSPDRAF